jgi:adenine deaminase
MTSLAELYPSDSELARLRAIASGRQAADLIVRGGLVLSPGTDEWLERDVVIGGRHIAALTPWGRFDAVHEIDARDAYVAPTFIDAHLHIEYTNLTPGELARVSVPRGTTTVLTDPNAAANVWGAEGMDFMLTTGTPLRIFQQVSPTTPGDSRLERGGARIPESTVRSRLRDDVTVTLGEGNPFDLGDESTSRYRAALAAGRRITGHTAAQTEESLWGYLAAGVGDDHNAATVGEALERVRLGAMITVMASSLADNTVPLFSDPDAIAPALSNMCFCADDKNAYDLMTEGHIDHHVRQAISFGIDTKLAYRMATTHPAGYYRLDQVLGLLAPSRLADLQILDDPAEVRPSVVVSAGRVVARNGNALFENNDAVPAWAFDTVRLPDALSPELFEVRADGPVARVRAMELYRGYFKRAFEAELPVVGGIVQPDVDADLLPFAVLDRHHGDGSRGVGFVRGFGLSRGAIAISMNCPNMNIAVVGTTSADMLHAVEELRAMGGGFVTVADGEVLAAVPLPIGGMMSADGFEATAEQLRLGHRATASLGCRIPSPYIVMSFIGLYSVPDYGVTERGLIDTATQDFVDAVLPDRCGHASR